MTSMLIKETMRGLELCILVKKYAATENDNIEKMSNLFKDFTDKSVFNSL